MKKKTQVENVLEYLQEHGSIDEMVASRFFRVGDIRSVIRTLRMVGYQIETVREKVTWAARKRVTYYLKEKEPAQARRLLQREEKPIRKNRTPKVLTITHKTGGWWKRR